VKGGANEWDLPEIGLRRLGAQDIQAFWKRYAALHGSGLSHGSLYSRWREVSDDVVISLYLTNRSVGLFVRGQRGERWVTTANRLSLYEPDLGIALNASLRGYEGCCYLTNLPLPITDPKSWPQAFDWLLAAERRYEAVLRSTLAEAQPAP
jgi:hypothetical protein